MVDTIIRDGTNTPRTLTEWVVRDNANTPRTIVEAWVRDVGNIPRLVYNPSGSATMEVTLDDYFLNAASFDGSGTATTALCTATASGGTAPYTYAWTVTGYGAPVTPTITSPATNSTAFTQTGMGIGESYPATFRCRATDAGMVTADAYVNATFSAYNSGEIP